MIHIDYGNTKETSSQNLIGHKVHEIQVWVFLTANLFDQKCMIQYEKTTQDWSEVCERKACF